MRIGQDIIAELQQRLDIEEVVGDYVTLKRKGRNLWACCPFHDEKSPSFSVAPDKGIYKCFGCGKAGDAINFVMEVDSLSFTDAVKQLAQKYGIELPEEEPEPEELQEHQEKESLYIILKFAADYFQQLLKEHPEGKSIGYSYLKERGFPDAIIKKFELGYSIDAWDGLLKAATNKGYSTDLLEKAGLIIRKDDKTYDRFRGRVIFPIHHPSGKPIAFGARQLITDKKQPKYINSPETPVYHKSNVLYGMHLAKKLIRQHDNCYLVEGYTDVISLHLCGIENVVASSGTSLTTEQIRLISRYSKHITVLYDGDPAGMKASLRGIDMILEGGLLAKVVVFPEGEDPDSYSRKVGATAFASYLKEEATDFVVFKTKLLLKEAGTDPLRRTEVARDIMGSIALLSDPVAQSVYLRECSNLLNIDEAVLMAELQKLLRRKKGQDAPEAPDYAPPLPQAAPAEPQKATTSEESLSLQEKESVRLLLRYGFHQVGENLPLHRYLLQEVAEIDFQTPVYREILDLYRRQLESGQVINEQYLLQHGSTAVKEVVADLSISRYELSEAWQERHNIYTTQETDHLEKAALQNILRLKFRLVRTLIRENQQQLHTAGTPEEVDQILLVHQELKKAEMELAGLLGNVIAG
ncbi:DNA primase [Cesiribacter sp. SM1]|uniref:DNA primase n=1 Tax=Cesiribacter sp. SM1 TaxID=2861196 RepID=UPI001CD29407|nr:DNA primase [Cesiribacter sp. SM1]